MADRTVAVELLAKVSPYTAGMRQAATATEQVAASMRAAAGAERQLEVAQRSGNASATRAATAARNLEAAHRKQLTAMTTLGKGFLTLGVVAGVGLGAAIKASMEFGKQMALVKTLAQASPAQFRALSDAALHAGTAFGYTATQVAQAEAELVKAGISVHDIMGGALTGTLTLAAAGQTDVAQATEIAASAMTQFALVGKDVPHIADLLAAGADKALGSVTDLGFGLSQVGTTAHQFGFNLDDTVAVLAEFAQAGQIGQKAGTELNQALLQLAAPTKQAQELMTAYGFSVYQANGNFVTFSQLADRLQKSFGQLAPQQRNAALATIFGSRAIRAANILYQDGAAGVEAWQKRIEDAGFATQQATGKLDSLSGDLQKLRAAFQTGLIETGDQATGSLRLLAQGATDVLDVFNALGPGTKTLVVDIGLMVTAAGLLGGAALVVIPKIVAFREALQALQVQATVTAGALDAEAEAAAAAGIANAAGAAGSGGKLGKTIGAAKGIGGPLTAVALLGAAVQANISRAEADQQKAIDKLVASPKAMAAAKTQLAQLKAAQAEQAAETKKNPAPFAGRELDLRATQIKNLTTTITAATKAVKENGDGADVAGTKQQKLERLQAKLAFAMLAAGENADATASAMIVLGKGADAASEDVKNLAKIIGTDMSNASKAFLKATDLTAIQGNLQKGFTGAVASARTFTRNITEVTKRGLDPQLVSELLAKGPAEAGPELDKLVNSHGQRMIRLANKSQRAITAINRQIVEQARLTSIAVNSNSDTLTNDLGTAMRIAQAKARSGGRATADELATQLHIGAGRVAAVAKEFGIGIEAGVVTPVRKASPEVQALMDKMHVLDSINAHPTVTIGGLSQAQSQLASLKAQLGHLSFTALRRDSGPTIPDGKPRTPARGGLQLGPGSGTSDSIPAMISNGEFVVNARATARNLALLRKINSATPAFARGGQAGRPGFASGGEVDFSDIFSLIQTSGGTKKKPLTAFATQFATATGATVRTDATFISNLENLSRRGFGFLALQLLQQGDHVAQVIAAQAVRWSNTKLGSLQRGLQSNAAQQKQMGLLPAELAISSALKSSRNPTLASIAAATGLELTDLQAGLQAMSKSLGGNVNARTLLQGLNTTGVYRQSSWGSTTANGGPPPFTIVVQDSSGQPVRAGEKAAAGAQRVFAINRGKW